MSGRSVRIVLLAGSVAVACGKVTADPGDLDAAAGTGSDGGSGAQSDAGGRDPGPDPGQAYRGLIQAFNRDYVDELGAQVQGGTVQALFGDYETERCTIEFTDRSCSVLTCNEKEPAPSPPVAGEIDMEIAGGLRIVRMAPATDGTYELIQLNGASLFSDGVPLSVTATGGDIPAFNGSFAAPVRINFGDGVPSAAGPPILISVASDYDLRWAPIANNFDQLRVVMASAPDQDGVRRVMDCRALTRTGDLLMSAAVLLSMPVGLVSFEARVVSEVTVYAGNDAVTLSAAAVALDARNNWARGTAQLVNPAP